MPRPAGSEHLTIPGDKPGSPFFRLTKGWACVLKEAGLSQIPVKALRHSWSTHSVGIIAPEHRQQLLGHRGTPMTDTVYLHQHGPDLARAAAKVEEHLRALLGDISLESGRVLAFDATERVRHQGRETGRTRGLLATRSFGAGSKAARVSRCSLGVMESALRAHHP